VLVARAAALRADQQHLTRHTSADLQAFAASAQEAETDVAGKIERAGVEVVGRRNAGEAPRTGEGMPQVPRPLEHGAARLVTGALSDSVRCIVCGTGVDYVVFA
jgi:hypothetical protein